MTFITAETEGAGAKWMIFSSLVVRRPSASDPLLQLLWQVKTQTLNVLDFNSGRNQILNCVSDSWPG